MDRQVLGRWLDAAGEAPYRADQILRWVYRDQVDRFEAMTNLKKGLRERLAAAFDIGRLTRRRI